MQPGVAVAKPVACNKVSESAALPMSASRILDIFAIKEAEAQRGERKKVSQYRASSQICNRGNASPSKKKFDVSMSMSSATETKSVSRRYIPSNLIELGGGDR